jgi:hypothetical protein
MPGLTGVFQEEVGENEAGLPRSQARRAALYGHAGLQECDRLPLAQEVPDVRRLRRTGAREERCSARPELEDVGEV